MTDTTNKLHAFPSFNQNDEEVATTVASNNQGGYKHVIELLEDQGMPLEAIQTWTPPKIVAFAGPKMSGKDTCASRVDAMQVLGIRGFRGSVSRTQFAGTVKAFIQDGFGYTKEQCEDGRIKEIVSPTYPFQAPRKPMQDIANWLRDQYGGYFHVRAWLRKNVMSRGSLIGSTAAFQSHLVTVTDLRFPEELGTLLELGACIVYVDRPEADAALRKAQSAGDPLATNISEAFWPLVRSKASAVLTNDGDLNQLYSRVDEVLMTHFPTLFNHTTEGRTRNG